MSKLSMRLSFVVAAGAMVALTACTPPTSANQANVNCAVGTAGGVAMGALAGNQFGRGAGNTAMTIAGATAGALAGSQLGC